MMPTSKTSTNANINNCYYTNTENLCHDIPTFLFLFSEEYVSQSFKSDIQVRTSSIKMWNDPMTHSARPTLFLRVMRLQLLLGATSSLEMSISTLDAALPDFELKLPPCHQRDELPSPTTIQPTALFSLQIFVPTKQPKINQPTNDPSCRPSFRPSNQLQYCKASIALNQPPIITNLRTLQAPGFLFEQDWNLQRFEILICEIQ